MMHGHTYIKLIYQISWDQSVEAELFRVGGQTDRHNETNSLFPQLYDCALKNRTKNTKNRNQSRKSEKSDA